MKYKENDKVTIQSEEWYNENKQSNGFILFRDGNKVSTFSPGMLKFCGATFTVGKVLTGSSIYPDHYTFVEDGGVYKWTDEMIAGLAEPDAQLYVRESTEQAPKPVQKPEPKPVEQPKPVQKPEPKPVEQPKPVQKPEPKPVEQPKRNDVGEQDSQNMSAFESFTLLLKPRNGQSLADCTSQAFRIMAMNETFPAAMFTFNGFDITISRKQ